MADKVVNPALLQSFTHDFGILLGPERGEPEPARNRVRNGKRVSIVKRQVNPSFCKKGGMAAPFFIKLDSGVELSHVWNKILRQSAVGQSRLGMGGFPPADRRGGDRFGPLVE
jgi:hypothetical protein